MKIRFNPQLVSLQFFDFSISLSQLLIDLVHLIYFAAISSIPMRAVAALCDKPQSKHLLLFTLPPVTARVVVANFQPVLALVAFPTRCTITREVLKHVRASSSIVTRVIEARIPLRSLPFAPFPPETSWTFALKEWRGILLRAGAPIEARRILAAPFCVTQLSLEPFFAVTFVAFHLIYTGTVLALMGSPHSPSSLNCILALIDVLVDSPCSGSCSHCGRFSICRCH